MKALQALKALRAQKALKERMVSMEKMVHKDQKEIQALMANQDWTVKMESMEQSDLLVLKAFKV